MHEGKVRLGVNGVLLGTTVKRLIEICCDAAKFAALTLRQTVEACQWRTL